MQKKNSDNTLVTSAAGTHKVFYYRGNPAKYWVEFQLLDENGTPVTGLTVYGTSDATRTGYTPESRMKGVTDSDGIVRFSDITLCDIQFFAESQPLADEMQNRPLALHRNPNAQPVNKSPFHKCIHDPEWRSELQIKAEEQGHSYHYLTIGELCDVAPKIEGWSEKNLPEFHFPTGKSFKGLALHGLKELNRRHVIEVCPFRAWVLALDNTQDYSLANALNLGIMADLAYAKEKENQTIAYLFKHKCLDLSVIPQFAEYPTFCHTLAVDVPFSQRYQDPVYLNTQDAEQPEGDSRLFYVESGTHIIVAWCGTDSLLNALTDIAYAPIECPKGVATGGNIHGGFWKAYNLARKHFDNAFKEIKRIAEQGQKQLFICGHSLGGH